MLRRLRCCRLGLAHSGSLLKGEPVGYSGAVPGRNAPLLGRPSLVLSPAGSPSSCRRRLVELLCSVLGVIGVGCRSRGELWLLLGERGL